MLAKINFYTASILFLITLAKFTRSINVDGLNHNSIKEDLNEKLEKATLEASVNKPEQQKKQGRSLGSECTFGNLTPKCLKIHALSLIEDLSGREELSLLPGLSIVKEDNTNNKTTPEEMAAELARSYPGRPDEKLNRYLLYRVGSYLDGHSLRYKLLDTETAKEAMEAADEERSLSETGRKGGGGLGGGGKKGGGMASLLAAAMMMKGTLAAVALGALALLAGKALMTALMSLLLSALVGLKSVGGGGHKSTTYEIITKPVVSHAHTQSHEEHHEHEHGGYGHHGYRRSYSLT